MKKTILIAALGLFSLSIMAQDAKPEEGFVFTTVKENPITSIKIKIVRVLAGVSPLLDSLNQSYFV